MGGGGATRADTLLYDAIASRNTDPMKGSARKILTRREKDVAPLLVHAVFKNAANNGIRGEIWLLWVQPRDIRGNFSLSPAGNRVIQVIPIHLRTDFQIFCISRAKKMEETIDESDELIKKVSFSLLGISETNLKAWRLE